MQPKSKIISIAKAKCPRCRQGDLFTDKPYKLLKFDRMHKTCPVCGLMYEIEPGFFTGAMYVSYAFSVAILVVVGFILYFFFGDPDISIYILVIFSIIVALFPLLFRYSRVLYIHWFGGVKYNPNDVK